MPYRRIPMSMGAKRSVLRKFDIHVNSIQKDKIFLSDELLARYSKLKPIINIELAEYDEAAGYHTGATNEKEVAFINLERNVSHFIQVLNMGVSRGLFTPKDRKMYGLEEKSSSLPRLIAIGEVCNWAERLFFGEQNRLKKEGTVPMTNPSAKEVESALVIFNKLECSQSVAKDHLLKEQQDIMDMEPEIDELIRDIWDEVEFHYRKLPAARKRHYARQWGVVYVSRTGEVEKEELTEEELN